MRIKVTGQYTNGNPYEKCFPKEQLSQADAEAYLQALDLNEIQATDNGFPLDYETLQAELYDDEFIEPAEISRLKIELYRRGLLGVVETYMQNKNGEVKIWWENVKSVDFYHANVQQAIVDLQGMTVELAKDIFRSANLIE